MSETTLDLRDVPHLLLIPKYQGDKGGRVEVLPYKMEEDFGLWMMACEYLMHLVAQKSGAGYERAMELLVKGAMTYKSKRMEA